MFVPIGATVTHAAHSVNGPVRLCRRHNALALVHQAQALPHGDGEVVAVQEPAHVLLALGHEMIVGLVDLGNGRAHDAREVEQLECPPRSTRRRTYGGRRTCLGARCPPREGPEPSGAISRCPASSSRRRGRETRAESPARSRVPTKGYRPDPRSSRNPPERGKSRRRAEGEGIDGVWGRTRAWLRLAGGCCRTRRRRREPGGPAPARRHRTRCRDHLVCLASPGRQVSESKAVV